MAELLDCPVCLGVYTDPYLLAPCGHTFCRACVGGLRPRRCPTCRAEFSPGDARPNFALRLVLQDLRISSVSGASSAEGGGASSSSSWKDAAGPHSSGLAGGVGASRIARAESLGKAVGREGEGSGGDTPSKDATLEALTALGVPWGLARLVREEDSHIALRFFLLDNSGSTATQDGHILTGEAGESRRLISCSRWEEIQHMALHQAAWNVRVGTPCEFLLLNPPSKRPAGSFRHGTDFVRVDPTEGSGESQLRALQDMLRAAMPRGPTPLAIRLEEFYRRVEDEIGAISENGQRVVLVIATDGLPTSLYSGSSTEGDRQRVVQVLRRLTSDFPVHVVVRLATDEAEVVDFYNRIDEELELPLEVIDDIESEAKEVAMQGNAWLTYSPLIHTLREGGTFVKLFDLLDERRLTPIESLLFARLLLQDEYEAPPQDPDDFCVYAVERVREVARVYDPLSKAMKPCLRPRELRRAVLPRRLCGWCSKRRRRRRGATGYNRLGDTRAMPPPLRSGPAEGLGAVVLGRPPTAV